MNRFTSTKSKDSLLRSVYLKDTDWLVGGPDEDYKVAAGTGIAAPNCAHGRV